MKSVFEKIIERLEERTSFLSDCTKCGNKDAEQQNKSYYAMMMYEVSDLVDDLIEIVKQEAEEYNNGWIPCSEHHPKAEKEVFILTAKGNMTTAMYEDGTIHSGDSIWNWFDCDFEYDEDADDYIISEGWWEYRHFNPDEVYNNLVDEEVIAWKPLPEPYKPKGE